MSAKGNLLALQANASMKAELARVYVRGCVRACVYVFVLCMFDEVF